jgi:uncharacterized membrane protein YbhN (UPF0104 family)
MTPFWKKNLQRTAAIALTLAFAYWLLKDQQWAALGAMLKPVPAWSMALAVAGFFLSYLLRTARVYDEFRHEAQGRLGVCLRIVLMHNMAINIVPFRGGEAAFPILLGKSLGIPFTRAVASLFWFRLQDALIVAVLALAVWPNLPLILRGAGIAAILIFAWVLPRWARQRPPDTSLPESKLARLRNAFAESVRHARLGWFWTAANWTAKLATQAWLLATLLNTNLGIGAAGALGAELAAILPIQGVAGFGTYEAGAAAALLSGGITLAEGLRAALALHLFVIACSVFVGMIAALSFRSAPCPPTKAFKKKKS